MLLYESVPRDRLTVAGVTAIALYALTPQVEAPSVATAVIDGHDTDPRPFKLQERTHSCPV